MGFNAAAVQQNLAVIATTLPVFKCPSAPGGAAIYNGAIPAGVIGPAVSWTAAAGDYSVTTGVRSGYANIANANVNPLDRGGVLVARSVGSPKTCRRCERTDGRTN